MDDSDMPTTRTTATTVLFVKRVSFFSSYTRLIDCNLVPGDPYQRFHTVWVGPLVVKELKRIVEASEITKFVFSDLHIQTLY